LSAGYLQIATSSASDDWPTDPAIFDALNREFGPLELDVCSTHENAKCSRYYTKDDNGLAQAWTGRVWMNPPYGRTIGTWMDKAAQSAAEGALVVCLVPARVNTAWWRRSAAQASLVRIYPGRLRFGDLAMPAPFPSAVIVFGKLQRRHGTEARQCESCNTWFFPARADGLTCSPKCRQARRRASQVTTDKRDKTKVKR
jgi:site-specific DNA-methyltransferase (adenine-specific)